MPRMKRLASILLFAPLLMVFGCAHQTGMPEASSVYRQDAALPSGIYRVEGQYIYHQLEVPYVIYREGKYYLLASTQNNPLMPDNEAKEAAYRGYVSESLGRGH